MQKTRLDVLLVEKGFFKSREKAKRAILEGVVTVDAKIAANPGTGFDAAVAIEVASKARDYVSRGGFKLEKALEQFDIDLKGRICADIGASTGGFTDCMLQNEAAKVYAIDVGHGQLDGGLLNNPKVISMEKMNFRYFTPDMINERVDFAVVDVSFISLDKIIAPLTKIMKDVSSAVCLIKPQFEAGPEYVTKSGVVRDLAVHERVIDTLVKFFERSGLMPVGLTVSPVKEKNGNTEYLIYLLKGCDSPPSGIDSRLIHKVVEAFGFS